DQWIAVPYRRAEVDLQRLGEELPGEAIALRGVEPARAISVLQPGLRRIRGLEVGLEVQKVIVQLGRSRIPAKPHVAVIVAGWAGVMPCDVGDPPGRRVVVVKSAPPEVAGEQVENYRRIGQRATGSKNDPPFRLATDVDHCAAAFEVGAALAACLDPRRAV